MVYVHSMQLFPANLLGQQQGQVQTKNLLTAIPRLFP